MTEREKALMRVQTFGFAVNEATLFLDYYHKAVKEYNDAVNIFITNFGPLEATQVKSRDNWTWTEGCMPWEGECNVEL